MATASNAITQYVMRSSLPSPRRIQCAHAM